MTIKEAVKILRMNEQEKWRSGISVEDEREAVKMAIEALKEQRPHGEWKYESYGQYLSSYKCSNCGFHGDKQWISCPYCDAKMKEGEAE